MVELNLLPYLIIDGNTLLANISGQSRHVRYELTHDLSTETELYAENLQPMGMFYVHF
jgi:hypothetical protein